MKDHGFAQDGIELVSVFCHTDDCCPVLGLDNSASEDRAVVIRDDFGAEIRMSRGQLTSFAEAAKEGLFDS